MANSRCLHSPYRMLAGENSPLLSGFRPIEITLLPFPRPCRNRLEQQQPRRRTCGRMSQMSHREAIDGLGHVRDELGECRAVIGRYCLACLLTF